MREPIDVIVNSSQCLTSGNDSLPSGKNCGRRDFFRISWLLAAMGLSPFLLLERGFAQVFNLGAFWKKRPIPPSVAYVTTMEQNTGASSYTFSSVSIGTADPTRLVVVAIHWDTGVTSDSVSNVTIGGSAATVVGQLASSGGKVCVALAARSIASGTTADISFNLTGSAVRAAVGVWTITRLSSTTERSVQTASGSNTGASVSLTVPGNGVVVAAQTSDNAVTCSWTSGGTSRYEASWGTYTERTGADYTLSSNSQSNVTVSTSSSGAGPQALIAATWR